MSAKDAQIPSHQSQPAVQRAPPSDWMCTVAGTPPRLFAATKCPRELRRNSHQQIAPNEGLMSHYIASGERASQPSIARTGMVVRQKKIGNKKGGGEITSANPLAPHPECDTTRQPTCHPRTKELQDSSLTRLTSVAATQLCRDVPHQKTELSNHQPQAASLPPPPPR